MPVTTTRKKNRIVREIFVLTTGLDVKLENFSDSLFVEGFEKRVCIYYKAIASLYTREELELLRHESRFRAYSMFFIMRGVGTKIRGKTEIEVAQIIMKCVRDNGAPVPEAKALREGHAWAKRLDASNIAEAQTMAQEYEALLKRHPDDKMYQWFNVVMGLTVDRKRSDRDLEKATQRVEVLDYRRDLAKKAGNGDVAVQLEIAHRLETGDKFEQNKMFAYYWFKRAQQNGGGEEAQKGLDRLRPQFTEIDLMRIEDMLEKNYLMY